jgi:hypothetical protein
LDLLKGKAQSVRERSLTEAKGLALKSNTSPDFDINRIRFV